MGIFDENGSYFKNKSTFMRFSTICMAIIYYFELTFLRLSLHKDNLLQKIVIFSWREAHSSTGMLVTGGRGGGNTKMYITRSIFELEARNFAWK